MAPTEFGVPAALESTNCTLGDWFRLCRPQLTKPRNIPQMLVFETMWAGDAL